MSPDERQISSVIDRAMRRSRFIAVAEAAAWGAAAATISLPAAIVVAIVVAGWRLRATRRQRVVQIVERAHPQAHNLFITAGELSSGVLLAKSHVRQRVFERAAAASREVDLPAALPAAAMIRAIAVAGAAWLVVVSATVWRGPLARVAPGIIAPQTSTTARSGPGALQVTATIQPPTYTKLRSSTVVDPLQIEALHGSTLTLTVDAGLIDTATVEHDGVTRPLLRGSDGRFVERIELTKTGYVSIGADEVGRRLIPIVVSPDALPAVRVATPGRDLVYADANPRVTFEARATDDFGLRTLSLQYTKVSGSGEQFDFQEGEIPLTIVRASDREWRGSGAQSLAALGLKDGDVLVYRAVAADARPGNGAASSDAFFIEISKLGVAAGDAFTLPEQESRYALSQEMLIIKTDRLNRARSSMTPAEAGDASLNLAVEQRMIRAEFVFMLGGEVQDEEVEAEQSTELQEGRLQNRGQRDLRAATIAMSQAEKLLTGVNTSDALTAERAAVAALQRAFARDRYILRALATRSQLDPQRRLTGNLSQAVDWRRETSHGGENRRALLLQDLVSGIGALSSASSLRPLSVPPPSPSRGQSGDGGRTQEGRSPASAAARAIELAREALRIDPESAALRRAAADLQRIADTWSASSPDARRQALEAVALAVAGEAAHALRGPQLTPPPVSPPLAGAFADALRRGGPR